MLFRNYMMADRTRYSPELGDVVVGRVVEVQTRRWAIEMGAQTQTALQLSAVQLPGGAQRRRTADDELNMRQLFQEGDVIVAEVRSFLAIIRALELLAVALL